MRRLLDAAAARSGRAQAARTPADMAAQESRRLRKFLFFSSENLEFPARPGACLNPKFTPVLRF
jgi:hypothetical protein